MGPLCELYKQGASLGDVGDKFGISERFVHRLFKEAGLQVRSRGRLSGVVSYPIEEMYALYQRGATLKQVGEKFGLSGNRVSQLFKEAGLEVRSRGRASGVVSRRIEEMHALYQQGATLEEIAEEFEITRERVRQLFKAAGLKTRSTAQAGQLKREATRLCMEDRKDEIVDTFRRVKDPQLVAQELDIPITTVTTVLREHLPAYEYRSIKQKPYKKKYSDQELIGFLQTAGAAVAGVLTVTRYNEFAKENRTADGRRWPTNQTYHHRFDSWRNALLAAGLGANPSSPIAGMTSFDSDRCLEAVRVVAGALGKIPTVEEYDDYAGESEGSLPSATTVRNRCGSWLQALRMAEL
jgi:AraC-like DNA-binding protein